MADNENKSQEELKREFEEDLRNSQEEKNNVITPSDEKIKEIDKSMEEENDLLEALSKNNVKTPINENENENENKKNLELNIDYIEGLYKTMFMNRMLEERQRIITEKLKEEKEKLKSEDLSYFERKKREKAFEKDLYEDYYSVEKELAEKRREAIERHEKLEKEIKKTGKLNQAAIQEKNQLETEYMLGDSLDSYIQAACMINKVQDKLKEKFPNVSKQLEADVMSMSDQQKFENKNLRRADGITKQFNKEFPDTQKEVNGFMSKLKGFASRNQKAIKTAGMILTGVGLVTNLPATAAVLGFNAIMKTKPMKNLKEKIANDIGHGLDKMGYTKDSKLRKGLAIAGLATGVALTVSVGLAAGGADLSSITEQAGEIKGAGLDMLNEGAKNTSTMASDLVESAKEKIKSLEEGYNNLNIEDGSVENSAVPETEVDKPTPPPLAVEESRQAMEQLMSEAAEKSSALLEKEISPEKLLELETELGVNKEELELLLKEEIANQILEGNYPSDIEMKLSNEDGEIVETLNFSASEIKESTLNVEAPNTTSGMVKVEVKEGDILTGMLEKIDSAEFDLVGADLPAVAQLIAEQNNIPDANRLLPGQMINMPSDTEALKNLVENNQERIQEIIKEQAQQAQQQTQQVAQQAVEQTISLPPKEFLMSNSDGITESLFDQEMSNREWGRLEDKLGVDKRELQELVQENIEKQITEGRFPTAISLDLQSYNGKHTETIMFESSQIEKTVNFIAQEAGVQNNNVAINYDDTKIENNQQVEKQERVKQKKGMKLS